MTTVSGPMFWGSEMGPWKSSFKKEGVHYNIFSCHDRDGMAALRELFPDGEANELNAVLFSTSGVHGLYATIEQIETEEADENGSKIGSVTFLVIHPRLVGMRYGNCEPKTPEDFAFLKKLRASSHRALAKIGMPEEQP